MIKVYLAGFFDTRERLVGIRRQFIAAGYAVTSSWLDEAPENQPKGAKTLTEAESNSNFAFTQEDLLHYAERDFADVVGSDMLIVDTLDVTPRGGREVEVGIALALNKPVIVVGPERNVFHKLAIQHYTGWGDAMADLESLPVMESLAEEIAFRRGG